tara:strand:- start:8271 stop:8567 length:297 start_codon:yes stop_codon:yes gene_type:complete
MNISKTRLQKIIKEEISKTLIESLSPQQLHKFDICIKETGDHEKCVEQLFVAWKHRHKMIRDYFELDPDEVISQDLEKQYDDEMHDRRREKEWDAWQR